MPFYVSLLWCWWSLLAPSVCQGSQGVGSVPGPALALPSVSLTGCCQHLLDPSTQPCISGELTKMRALMWQGVGSLCKLVIAPQGQARESLGPSEIDRSCLKACIQLCLSETRTASSFLRHCPIPNGIISSHIRLHIQAPHLLWQMTEMTHTDLRCP